MSMILMTAMALLLLLLLLDSSKLLKDGGISRARQCSFQASGLSGSSASHKQEHQQQSGA